LFFSLVYFYNDYSESSVTLSGGNLPQTYYLAQFHFHWGYNDYEGSEHTINSVKFPLEMHMVFNNISSTTATADNAVVVSILFQLSSADNSVLTPMLNFITPVRSQLNSDTNVTFNAGSILPSTTISTYYQYAGSLTSPPCYQGITWIIPQAYIQISSNQLQTFRNTTYGSAISDDAQPAPANHRDEQLLNGRVVWTSVNPGSSTTSAAPSVFNFSILTFILLNVAFAFNLSA
jgi:carbonic anhydrase